MKAVKRVLKVIADILVIALLLALIFGWFRFRLIRTAADILNGDSGQVRWVLIDKRAKSLEDMARGDIVLFRYFTDAEHVRLGKILGFPGDTVWVDNGIAYVNAQKVSGANDRDRGRIHQRVVSDNAVFLSEGTNGNPLTSGYRMNRAELISGKKVAVLLPFRDLSFGGSRPFVD